MARSSGFKAAEPIDHRNPPPRPGGHGCLPLEDARAQAAHGQHSQVAKILEIH
jgi:hypothetical protein